MFFADATSKAARNPSAAEPIAVIAFVALKLTGGRQRIVHQRTECPAIAKNTAQSIWQVIAWVLTLACLNPFVAARDQSMALLQANGLGSGPVQLVAVLWVIGRAVHRGAGTDIPVFAVDYRDVLPGVAGHHRTYPPRQKDSACGPIVGVRSPDRQTSLGTTGLAKCVIVNLSGSTRSPE